MKNSSSEMRSSIQQHALNLPSPLEGAPSPLNGERLPRKPSRIAPQNRSGGFPAAESGRLENRPSGFMGSLDLQNWTRLGTMNLIDPGPFASPRSVTAVHSDAPARAARWGDWFRSATRALIGDRLVAIPAGKICSFWI